MFNVYKKLSRITRMIMRKIMEENSAIDTKDKGIEIEETRGKIIQYTYM